MNGGALNAARANNNRTYGEVTNSGLGRLCALDAKTYGQWGTDPCWIVPALARERVRGLPALVRRGLRLRLEHRWWTLLAVALQRRVAHACMMTVGEDLAGDIGEAPPRLADLPPVPQPCRPHEVTKLTGGHFLSKHVS